LRTSTFPNVLGWCQQIAELLREGSLAINAEGLLLLNNAELPVMTSQAMIVLIPTILKLCLTAEETVGIVNIAVLLKFVSDAIAAACEGNLELNLSRNENHITIFEAAPIAITSCISHMKILNTSLFFSQFRELGLFGSFVKLALRAKELSQSKFLDATVSQSEADRARNVKGILLSLDCIGR
jgi:hypothetical protein